MAKNNVTAPEIEVMGEEVISKTEHFFENNGKKIIYAIIAVVAIALVVFGYKAAVVAPRAEKASEMLYKAQLTMEAQTPNYKLALEGDVTTPGLIEVVEKYGSTPSGNLAAHLAGVCYLHTEDLAAAAKYLAKYKPVKGVVGSVINAQNYALQGDVAVEMDNYSAAVSLFKKAATASQNPLTTPSYLFKAALAAEAAGDSSNAKAIFTELKNNYPGTTEASSADKYLASMK